MLESSRDVVLKVPGAGTDPPLLIQHHEVPASLVFRRAMEAFRGQILWFDRAISEIHMPAQALYLLNELLVPHRVE
jgi:hypothetical protein